MYACKRVNNKERACARNIYARPAGATPPTHPIDAPARLAFGIGALRLALLRKARRLRLRARPVLGAAYNRR